MQPEKQTNRRTEGLLARSESIRRAAARARAHNEGTQGKPSERRPMDDRYRNGLSEKKADDETRLSLDGSETGETVEDIEELVALEEIEEAEELPPAVDDLHKEPPHLTRAGLRDLVRSYERNEDPFALLDFSLNFSYLNPAFRGLLREYRYPEASNLQHIVSRALSFETAQEMRSKLKDSKQGYAWKGMLTHRSKDCPARITKISVAPLWLEETPDEAPEAYAVLFDDVTDENRLQLRNAFDSLLKASLKKDNDTGRHIERVNLYASRLSHELYGDPRWPQVDVDFIEDIGFLAAMHDVGKIGTPDDILNKTGPLNEFEWGIMKEHTINGAFILDGYPNPMAKQIALAHHEWWNGSGYPYNLEGDMIPIAARICSIADVYDALRMKRSYKPPFPHTLAIEKIAKERGIHFDPALVDRLARAEKDFDKIFSENED